MAGQGRWQYALVWVPGEEFSVARLVAHSTDGRRHPWDSWIMDATPQIPKAPEVAYQLYLASLSALERTGPPE